MGQSHHLWWRIPFKAATPYSKLPVHWTEVNWTAEGVEGRLFISVRMQRPSRQFFRTDVPANRLSIYGAVADLCKKFQTRVGLDKTHIVEEQSESMVAATDLYDLQNSPANELKRRDPVHNYRQRMQNLSDEAQLIKLSTDAGFVKTVGLGQFFMTRDTEAFSVVGHIGCREYSLPRDNLSSEPKGWIRKGTKIGPVLEVKINYHQGQPGVEIRIGSLSGDNSQSWVRISNGLNEFVRDLTEKSRIPDEEKNDSARTGQPGSQELRIEPRSQKETDRPSAKAKLEPKSKPIRQPSLEHISILEQRWLDVELDPNKVNYSQSWRFEEDDYIASTWTGYSSRRRRGNWILATEEGQ